MSVETELQLQVPTREEDLRTAELAERIVAYWAERGHSVAITLKRAPFNFKTRHAALYITSDMRNGWPGDHV